MGKEDGDRSVHGVRQFGGTYQEHELHGHHGMDEQYPIVRGRTNGESDGQLEPKPRQCEHEKEDE
jgi:hypothetical protein